MTITEAFKNADHVVCYTCQTTTAHEVKVDPRANIFFACKVCGEEVNDRDAEIGVEKQNDTAPNS